MAIQEMDLTIEYRPGRKNEKADALSHYPTSTDSTCDDSPHVVVATTHIHDSLENHQREDPKLLPIITYLSEGKLPLDDQEAKFLLLNEDKYTLVDGVLFHIESDKSLRIIPPTADRKGLWEQLHSGTCGGHLKCAKAHGQLSRHYWWSGMRTDIVNWSRGCLTCATRGVGRKLKPSLTPIPVGGPFDRVGVDIIQYTKSSKGNQYAVVFVDYLTKWPEVFPVRDQTAPKLLVENIICHHGVPNQLLSDRGANFLSNLLKEVYSLMGVKKLNTTAYHPQTDGLVERFNSEMLSKSVKRNGRDWDQHISYVLFAYRTSPQSSTGESPFFLLYGRDPQLPTEAVLTIDPDRTTIDTDDRSDAKNGKCLEAGKLNELSNIKREYTIELPKNPKYKLVIEYLYLCLQPSKFQVTSLLDPSTAPIVSSRDVKIPFSPVQ